MIQKGIQFRPMLRDEWGTGTGAKARRACANILRVRRCLLLRNGNLVALLRYSNHVNGWRNAQQRPRL